MLDIKIKLEIGSLYRRIDGGWLCEKNKPINTIKLTSEDLLLLIDIQIKEVNSLIGISKRQTKYTFYFLFENKIGFMSVIEPNSSFQRLNDMLIFVKVS